VAVFIGDYFARGSKRSGAWCSAMRSQKKLGGDVRPIVVNVCNFAKGEPALLSYDDARTLFHEFGHALHQMLSDVTYGSISGTSVARDFVELPSQLYEHWLEVPEVLAKTRPPRRDGGGDPAGPAGQAIWPPDLRHGVPDGGIRGLGAGRSGFPRRRRAGPIRWSAQAETLERIGMPRAIGMRHATPQFAHVFAGDGYSSGYYSYMWSEVMDADAFAAFEEAGDAFDPALAEKLETHILSAGGSEEELYTAFRGRMPGVEALLHRVAFRAKRRPELSADGCRAFLHARGPSSRRKAGGRAISSDSRLCSSNQSTICRGFQKTVSGNGPGGQRDIRQQHTGFGIKPSLKGFGHARFTDTTLEAWRGDHKLQRHHRDGKREDWPYLTGNGENGELVDHERPFARCAHVGLAHRRELRPRLWQHHVRPLQTLGHM
jgi:hypothetical protein